MHAQDSISLFLSDDLDETVRVEVGLSTRVGGEAKLADAVLHTSGFEFLLCLSNPCNLGVSVDDRRDGIVVDVSVSGLHELDSSDALFFGFVGKHRSKGNITNAFDVRYRGVELVVDDNTALGVQFHTDSFEIQTLDIRSASNSDENNIRFERFLLSTLGSLSLDGNLAVFLLRGQHLGVGLELHALFSQ